MLRHSIWSIHLIFALFLNRLNAYQFLIPRELICRLLEFLKFPKSLICQSSSSTRCRWHVFFVESTLKGIFPEIVWIEAHILWIRVSFDLHIRCYIFQEEFAFTFIWTLCFKFFNSPFPFNDLICTEMA